MCTENPPGVYCNRSTDEKVVSTFVSKVVMMGMNPSQCNVYHDIQVIGLINRKITAIFRHLDINECGMIKMIDVEIPNI